MSNRSAGGRDELSRGLHELRQAAGLSGVEAAAGADTSQSKISRVESGRTLPTPEFVDTLCRLYRAKADERRRLVAMAQDVRAANRRVVLRRSVAPFQQQIGRIVQQSALVRTFAPIGLPGLLQTAEYTRALFFSGDDLSAEAAEQGTAARLANQAILDDLGSRRRFVMVMTEGALGWSLGSPEMMADQIEHIAAATYRPNVRIGIIPFGEPAPVLPLHSWEMYDERLVIAGTTTATAMLDDSRDVAAYLILFDQLERLAVFDDQARVILTQVADRYRGLG